MYNEHVSTLGAWVQKRLLSGLISGVLSLLCVVFLIPTPIVQAASSDWSTYGFGPGHGGYNGMETIINSSTAPNLKLHWTASAGGTISSQPIVSNGVVYWGSWDGNEHATTINNTPLWSTFLGRISQDCDNVTLGVTGTATELPVTINGKTTPVVYVGGGNATFYALNATTGAILWSRPLGAPPNNFIFGSPVVYNGSVYIGLASLGDCPLVQGKLFQLDAVTGGVQHVFSIVPNGCIGGTLWSTPTIDVANGTIFIATGNNGSCSVHESFAIAVVKLRAADLSVVSFWQVPTSQLVFDSDFGATPTLFNATINGVATLMVGVANKNGLYYAFNRNNLGAGPIWIDRVAVNSGVSCPECGDGSIASSAWDGQRLYLAGGNTFIHGVSCKGSLRAVDPASGHTIWEHCMQSGPVLGAVTVVPGVVMVGEGPWIVGVDALSGNTIFRFNDSNGNSTFYGSMAISSGVMYAGNHDGHLYAIGI